MQRKLELDMSPSEVIELLKENAPKNDLEGFKQSVIQSFKIPEFELSKREKRIRFTGEREFVVEYAYGIYALKGQIVNEAGAVAVYLQPQKQLPMKIIKWLPIIMVSYIFILLFIVSVSDERMTFWSYIVIGSALCIWSIVMFAFYLVIKLVGGRRAEKDLYDYTYSALEAHITQETDLNKEEV